MLTMDSKSTQPGFFVLGEAEVHEHDERPTIPPGGQVYVPVEILSDDDQTVLKEMQLSLEQFGFSLGRAPLSRLIKASPVFSSELQSKIYPVLKPSNYLAIYQSWKIVNDIRQKNSGIVFRRTPTVGDALIYILYEGDYQAMGKDGVQIPPPANSLSPQKPRPMGLNRMAVDVEGVTNALGHSTLSAPPRPGASHQINIPSSQRQPPIAPVNTGAIYTVPAPLSWNPGSGPTTHTLPQTTLANDQHVFHYTQHPSGSSPTTHMLPQTTLASNQHVFYYTQYPPGSSPTTHTLPQTTHASNQHIFRYTRRLSGIIGCELTPSTMVSSSVLSPAADYYLWAHGYQPGSIRLIQDMYERAENMDCFIDELAKAGVPVAEGQYIFTLIHGRL